MHIHQLHYGNEDDLLRRSQGVMVRGHFSYGTSHEMRNIRTDLICGKEITRYECNAAEFASAYYYCFWDVGIFP